MGDEDEWERKIQRVAKAVLSDSSEEIEFVVVLVQRTRASVGGAPWAVWEAIRVSRAGQLKIIFHAATQSRAAIEAAKRIDAWGRPAKIVRMTSEGGYRKVAQSQRGTRRIVVSPFRRLGRRSRD